MPLDDAQYTRLQVLLQGLSGEQLYASAKFVANQVEREKQYGQDMFLSVKQAAWLESLYAEKVGQLPGERLDQPGVPVKSGVTPRMAGKMRDDEIDPDIDDEIKF